MRGAVPAVLSKTKQHAPGSGLLAAANRRAKNQGIRSSGELSPNRPETRSNIGNRLRSSRISSWLLSSLKSSLAFVAHLNCHAVSEETSAFARKGACRKYGHPLLLDGQTGGPVKEDNRSQGRVALR